MPIYDYACSACGHTTEVIHGIHEGGPRFCPNCGAEGSLKKAFAAPAVHFKGSGWAKKDRSATSSPGKAGKGKDASGGADGGTGTGTGTSTESGTSNSTGTDSGTKGGSASEAPAAAGASTKSSAGGSNAKSGGRHD